MNWQDKLMEHLFPGYIKRRSDMLGELLLKIPHTADGKPIVLGMPVFFENDDRSFFGDDPVVEEVVESMNLGRAFDSYEGQFTITTSNREGGNCDFYAEKENVPLPYWSE